MGWEVINHADFYSLLGGCFLDLYPTVVGPGGVKFKSKMTSVWGQADFLLSVWLGVSSSVSCTW